MPEIRFQVRWPDQSEELCYSPSLVVKSYFTLDQEYDLADFVERARTSLNIASERVAAKYGFPCGLAIGQLQHIEEKAAQFQALEQPKVKVLKFVE